VKTGLFVFRNKNISLIERGELVGDSKAY
jgi:hypothetical protein